MKWWGLCVIQLLRSLSAILSLFIFCLGITPGQIPLSVYVVVPVQPHPNHSLEVLYLLLLQLTPEIPVAETVNHEDALLGFIVYVSHLVGFWGSGSYSDAHGQGHQHPVDRGKRGKWVHKFIHLLKYILLHAGRIWLPAAGSWC